MDEPPIAEAYREFLETPLPAPNGEAAEARQATGAERARVLFHAAARRVPAYRDWLARQGCDLTPLLSA